MSHDDHAEAVASRDRADLPGEDEKMAQGEDAQHGPVQQAPEEPQATGERSQGTVEGETSVEDSEPADQHSVQPSVDASTVSEQAIVLDRQTLEATGDEVVDAVLEQFDRVTGEPLSTHIEAAEKVHETLQSRLSDLGDG